MKASASSSAAAMSPRPRAAPLRLYKKGGARAHAARTHAASRGGAPGAQRAGTYPASAAQARATEAERVGKRWHVIIQTTPPKGRGLRPGLPLCSRARSPLVRAFSPPPSLPPSLSVSVSFRDRISLCCPGCLETYSVDHTGLELKDPLASASGVLG